MRRVVAAGSVAQERLKTGGRVVVAVLVAVKRIITDGRVAVAGRVAEKYLAAISDVEAAGGVVKSALSRWPYYGCRSCCCRVKHRWPCCYAGSGVNRRPDAVLWLQLQCEARRPMAVLLLPVVLQRGA